MRTKINRIINLSLVLICLTTIVTCSDDDDDSAATSETSTEENSIAVSNNSDVMEKTPQADPSKVDYGKSASLALEEKGGGGSGFSLKLDQKITAVKNSTDGVGFKVEQCNDKSGTVGSDGSFALTYDTSAKIASGKIVPKFYRKTYSRGTAEGGLDANYDIIHTVTNRPTTSAEYEYNLEFTENNKYAVTIKLEGKTKTVYFTGASSSGTMAAKWDSSKGCAKMQNGSNFPFTYTTAADGKKTFSSGTDETYCADLTSFATVKSNASVTFWDCSIPTGTTRNDLNITAPKLEDYGGDKCKAASGFWHDSSTSVDESTCGSGDSLTSVTCFLDRFYARVVQRENSTYRSMECKLIGVQGATDASVISDVGLDNLAADAFVIISEGRK